MILPSNYTPLGYIESSGNQYIDTGFKANQNTKIVLDCEITYGTDWIMIAGSYDSNAYFSWWANGSQIYAYYGSDNKNAAAPSGRTVLIADKNVWTAGTATGTFSASTFSASSSICLFYVAQGGTKYAKATMKIYSCQIYDNGTLVRDFVPCGRGFRDAGLYDLVNGKFYANAGSGYFIEGEYVPEVTGDYQFIYLPASKVYACGNTIANDPSSTGEYPDVFGSFKASTGLTQDGSTFSLASPTYRFTLDTYELHGSELPSAGSYIEVGGVIYQVTSDSKVTTEYSSTGGWTSTLYTSTAIYITNLKQVILGTPNTGSDHSALIDSTQRVIDGGFALVNGTEYEISKGIALIDGTGRDITFGSGAYIDVETWNQAEEFSSNQGKATVTHTVTDDALTGTASYSKGWYSVPSSKYCAGVTWHILDEETDDLYELQANDIVEWEFSWTKNGNGAVGRILFFTNKSDSWSSNVAEFSESGTYLVTRGCYMEFDCHVQCSNYDTQSILSITKLTVNGKDVWIK
jgi:hypothetical protein